MGAVKPPLLKTYRRVGENRTCSEGLGYKSQTYSFIYKVKTFFFLYIVKTFEEERVDVNTDSGKRW